MTINIEEVLERAFKQAFLRSLDQTVQAIEEKIERVFEYFLEEGIRWEKKKPGFKKWYLNCYGAIER